jgi:CsoR family transcriptional regulator, copper-sensing transcriptional repressor
LLLYGKIENIYPPGGVMERGEYYLSHETHHKHRKSIENRLARIEGHVRSVKEMANSERECGDLLIQLAAIRSAIDSCGKLILKDHLEGCVVIAARNGNEEEVLTQLNDAIDKFIR